MNFYLWDLLICAVLIVFIWALSLHQDNTDAQALATLASAIAAAFIAASGLLVALIRWLL